MNIKRLKIFILARLVSGCYRLGKWLEYKMSDIIEK